MDYGKLNLKLTGRCKESRKLRRNTYAIRRRGTAADKQGAIAVRLHNTDILTFTRRNGGEYVTFNTGGWSTVTTKERMNGYAPDGFDVGSTRGDWYLYGPRKRTDAPKDAPYWDARERWAFFSGITVNVKTGRPIVEHVRQAEKLERKRVERRKEEARERRAEKRYVRVCEALARCFSGITYHERCAASAVSDMLVGLRESMCAPAESIAEAFYYIGERMKACYEVDVAPPADATLAWHFITADWYTQHDGTPIRTGRTLRVRGAVRPCSNGLHASVRAYDAHSYHSGAVACRVVLWGQIRHDSNKLAAEYRRVLWAVAVPAGLDRYGMDADQFEAALNAAPKIAGPHDEAGE